MFSPEKTLAVLLSLLLVTSVGAAAVSAGGSSIAASNDDFEEFDDLEGLDTADEVYVSDDGNAVLVYEENHSDEADDDVALSGDFGADVESGLLHLLYEGEFGDLLEDSDDEPELTGEATARMTPDDLTGTADVVAEKPDDFVDLSGTVDHTQTQSTYSSSTSFSMTVENEDDDSDEYGDAVPASQTDLFSTVAFETESTTTASTFESTGSLSTVSHEDAMFGQKDREELYEVTITEDDGDYRLEVTEHKQITDWEREAWDTRENAENRLESQFSSISMELGGTANFTLESYDFEEGEEAHDVFLEYEVTLSDVSEQLSVSLADELASEHELDLSEAEAKAIADRIAKLHVERLHVSSETDGLDRTVEWDVEIDNYDEFVLGLFELAESIDELDDELADQLDETRGLLDAQEAADLRQTSTLEFAVETDDETNQTSVEFESESNADNWADYVDEVEDRGLEEYLTETVYDLELTTEGEEIEIVGSFEVEHEGMLETYLEELIEEAREEPLLDEDLAESLEEFQQTEFEAAKAAVSLSETTFTVESGAQFGNLTAPQTSDNLTVTGFHGETENDVTTMYLSVADFVDEDDAADESAIRSHDRVDDDTDVHAAGEWDREFPTTDVQSVSEFLDDDDDGSLLSVGSAGVAVGVLAVLALVGAVAYRRVV